MNIYTQNQLKLEEYHQWREWFPLRKEHCDILTTEYCYKIEKRLYSNEEQYYLPLIEIKKDLEERGYQIIQEKNKIIIKKILNCNVLE